MRTADTGGRPLTIQMIEDARKLLADVHIPNRPSSLFGIDIIESPVVLQQVLKLRDDAPVTEEFRAQMNAWLLEMFGVRDVSVVPRNVAFMFGNSVVMRSDQIVKLSGV